MVAENTSQTTSLLNPESAQRTEAAGVGATSWKTAAVHSPMNPITGAATGSVIRPTTTNTKSAVYCQAAGVRPAGDGDSQSRPPTATGTSQLTRLNRVVRNVKNAKNAKNARIAKSTRV